MNNKQKAKILDYMKNHAETLLNEKVKDIEGYNAQQLILARYAAQIFMTSFKEAKRRFNLSE